MSAPLEPYPWSSKTICLGVAPELGWRLAPLMILDKVGSTDVWGRVRAAHRLAFASAPPNVTPVLPQKHHVPLRSLAVQIKLLVLL